MLTRNFAARDRDFDVIGDLWATLVDGQKPSSFEQARFLTAYTHVVGECVAAVELVYKGERGNRGLSKWRLGSLLRDVLTMNQHLMGSLRTNEMAGRLLLGARTAQMAVLSITGSLDRDHGLGIPQITGTLTSELLIRAPRS